MSVEEVLQRTGRTCKAFFFLILGKKKKRNNKNKKERDKKNYYSKAEKNPKIDR